MSQFRADEGIGDEGSYQKRITITHIRYSIANLHTIVIDYCE